MKKDQLFLSTIAPDAAEEARRHGLGLEIAEYCTAWNMDEQFETTHAAVTKELAGVGRKLLHAPFSELFPCAVDPKARELAALRYRQAIALARRYDVRKIIIHGGFNERLYYPCWYTEQSIVFWKDFLKEDPGVDIVLENVLEEQPEMMIEIFREVDNPRLRMCLDVGHVNAYSPVPVEEWVSACAEFLSHFHIHNNAPRERERSPWPRCSGRRRRSARRRLLHWKCFRRHRRSAGCWKSVFWRGEHGRKTEQTAFRRFPFG